MTLSRNLRHRRERPNSTDLHQRTVRKRKRTAALAAGIATLAAGPAFAQASWTVGPVTPNWSSTVQWTPPIPPDSPHPVDTYVPADPGAVGFNPELWVNSSNGRTQVGQVGGDGKARFNCTPAFIKRADPLLYPGQVNIGHDHTFFGWMDKDNIQNASHTVVRANPKSTCMGGPMNASPYWTPSMKKLRNGLALTLMPNVATFYYTHLGADGANTTYLRRNIGFIGGADPMNYNDTAKRAEYAAVGLEYPGSPDTPAGFFGFQCVPTATGTQAPVLAAHAMKSPSGITLTTEARYLVGPGGADPWNGGCNGPGIIVAMVNAPECHDATNLRSPNMRDHYRYMTRSPDNAVSNQCPANYVKNLSFQVKEEFSHNGWSADVRYWYLASDRMNPPSTSGDPTSKDPCRQTGPYFCSGSTLHFDLIQAWYDLEMRRWQRNCGGLTIGGIVGTFADCNNGATDNNRSLIYNVAPPEPNLSQNPVRSLPTARAGTSIEAQRFFKPDPGTTTSNASGVHAGH